MLRVGNSFPVGYRSFGYICTNCGRVKLDENWKEVLKNHDTGVNLL